MHNKKLTHFQGQIETALEKFRSDLGLRLKKLFSVLHVKTYITGASIRKREGFSPINLLLVLTNLAFLHIWTVHDLLHRPFQVLLKARKDTFYRFKKAEWSWRPFYRRFLASLGRGLQWSRTLKGNCLVLDTTVLPKRGSTMENLSLVYDHSQGKTVPGYEVLTLGLLTPRNFWPVDFDFRFSRTAPAGAEEARPVKARRGDGPSPQGRQRVYPAGVGPKYAEGGPGSRDSGPLPAGGRLVYFPQILSGRERPGPADHRSSEARPHPLLSGRGWVYPGTTLSGHKHLLIKVEELGLSPLRVPVSCGYGLKGTIVLTRGYKEPDPEARPGRKIKVEPSWTAFFTTDLTLTAIQVVQKYLGRWSIEVFFKEAKQRLGLGQEQGHSFAAQVFSVLQAFFRYSLLAYLLEQDEQAKTIGEIFRQLEEETGKLTFLERLRHHFSTFLTTILNALADFCDSDPRFRSCLEIITNTFNPFSPLQGCET